MILEMMAVFAWLADRSGLRALIVTGDGPAFCSGGDVNTFQEGVRAEEIDLPSEVRRGAEALHQAIVDLRRIPFPVIAAVNPPARRPAPASRWRSPATRGSPPSRPSSPAPTAASAPPRTAA